MTPRRATTLHILSAGAAKAVVQSLAAEPGDQAIAVHAAFDAAGAIRAQFLAGVPCDVLILPQPMHDMLATERRVDTGTIAPLGGVPTGIAVPTGEATPSIVDADALRASLLEASELFCPDTGRSTAGIHFMRMLRELRIDGRVAARVRAHANGALAMAALAAETAQRRSALGCTQVTEILYTPGVTLVGPLPAPFELTTVYAVAVSRDAVEPALAQEFAARLAGVENLMLRQSHGFQ